MKPADKALGLDERISRRDYINSTVYASGAALMASMCPAHLLAKEDWNGDSGVGDYSGSNGNTHDVMTEGHKIRDHVYRVLPENVIDTREEYDCVIVGGGISGLAAALFFQRQSGDRMNCIVLENHAIFGGEGRQNEFIVDGQRIITHQGSAMWFPPVEGTFLADFYRSIGITSWQFPYQKWSGADPELNLSRSSYFRGTSSSGFFFGKKFGKTPGEWLVDPWGKKLAGAPIPEQAVRELLGMRMSTRQEENRPKTHGDAASRHLDSISLEQDLMDRYHLSQETIRQFVYAGSGSGMGPDALSAYADYAADVLYPWDYAKGSQMFPGGNTGVARHIIKSMLPDVIPGPATMENVCRSSVNLSALDRHGQNVRVRLGSTAVWVEHQGNPARARYLKVIYSRKGKLYSLRARSVVAAGGSWTSKHILKQLPESHVKAYAQFHRAPCLMANVALRNWRFLYKLGLTDCQWFEGIGNSATVRTTATLGAVSPTINPDSPIALTLKILFTSPGQPIAKQVAQGRVELYSTSFSEYERRIREHFTEMFSTAGFDARKDIAGLILNRWGHAYLSPQPGFFFGREGEPAPGEVLRHQPFGRIAFANSDVSGIMDHRASIDEAKRAVGQVFNLLP